MLLIEDYQAKIPCRRNDRGASSPAKTMTEREPDHALSSISIGLCRINAGDITEQSGKAFENLGAVVNLGHEYQGTPFGSSGGGHKLGQ